MTALQTNHIKDHEIQINQPPKTNRQERTSKNGGQNIPKPSEKVRKESNFRRR